MITLPQLFILTDRTLLPAGRTVIEQVERCLEGGATHVILRERDLPSQVRRELAQALTAIGATVIAAGDQVRGVAGIHQRSAASGPVRGFVGRSCHTREEVERASRDGCTYVTLGPSRPPIPSPDTAHQSRRRPLSTFPFPPTPWAG